ncbi:beta-ketoacyl-[acyl-carrier-protein] synthase family protein [Thiococcus pfennigii]|uniref:beta-ketoacyl-[acyl-carrier-protein] synthase family protein n=1 Tax=Thiococcus pfennigii TaxID=1057 RepID=UPI00190671D5|nr:beta-ketoacyl-[acyl-carrier-protein] synthase family protein [Thiococcus pfennigii]
MLKREKKVAVTGIGMITALGCSAPECWGGMLAGTSGIARIRRLDVSDCITQIGGELPDRYYEMEEQAFSRRLFKQTEVTTRLGILCGREAMADSGFSVEGRDPLACAVISGSGQTGYEETFDLNGEPGKFAIIQQMANALSGWLSIEYGFQGPSYNVATACASGAFAVAAAYRHIASGAGEAVLVIGVDAMVSPRAIKGFNQLAALSERNDDPQAASRPFDLERDGFVLANGGAALMLESEAAARRRGARIYALISGAGLCSESYNIVAPEPSGTAMAQAMTLAMQDGEIAPEQVQYISAHGTSTPHNDAAETAAIKKAFGEQARRLAVSSQKSMTGHTIGGAGAIECATTALCLHHGVITPTINYRTPDPRCDLDYVPNTAREAKDLTFALSNSFGFGGHNSTILIEKVR